MDTIFALATAQGKAGVAVIRVSGPDAFQCAGMLCSVPDVRCPSVRILRDGAGEEIDQALVLSFAKDASFTGEPVVEFQTHGSLAVVNAILSTLNTSHCARLAEPGEFTRRALDNGRLDLTQVEALSDLIDAETETQRRHAHRMFRGELRKTADRWRDQLLQAAALIEATIDFADEDVPVDVSADVKTLIEAVLNDIDKELGGFKVSERIRSGFEVAIVGAPNVGKSTLLNALAGRDAALTSEVAGTTRDVIEVRMDVNGIPVTFLDTAGLRETDDVVEQLGIKAALSRSEGADLRVFLRLGCEPVPAFVQENDIVVYAMGDVLDQPGDAISGRTGFGIDRLLQKIDDRFRRWIGDASLISHERHKMSLTTARASLLNALEALGSRDGADELVADDLRICARALERLVGRFDVEDLLGEIFSRFCIGK